MGDLANQIGNKNRKKKTKKKKQKISVTLGNYETIFGDLRVRSSTKFYPLGFNCNRKVGSTRSAYYNGFLEFCLNQWTAEGVMISMRFGDEKFETLGMIQILKEWHDDKRY